MTGTEIYPEQMYEVYDPSRAQILAFFYHEEDAKLFRKAFEKRRNKRESERA